MRFLLLFGFSLRISMKVEVPIWMLCRGIGGIFYWMIGMVLLFLMVLILNLVLRQIVVAVALVTAIRVMVVVVVAAVLTILAVAAAVVVVVVPRAEVVNKFNSYTIKPVLSYRI